MTTVIKSLNDTTVSVLSAVGTVASQVGNTINTVAKTLDMLDMFVVTAHTKQKANTAFDISDFYSTLIQESAIASAKRELKLAETLHANADLKKFYVTHEAKYTAIIAQLTAKPVE